MIDGVKFSINPSSVRNSDVLEFKNNGNRQRARYKGLIVDLYSNSCYVQGSIHKFANDGSHNADDFTLSKFIETLQVLSMDLNINLETSVFSGLEYGVNVPLPFEVQRFTDAVLYCKNGNILNTKLGIEIPFADYNIKMYLKTAEGQKDSLRYEVKIKRKRVLKSKLKSDVSFFNTLLDLTSSELWKALGKDLLKVYDDMLIVDIKSVDVSKLSSKEVEIWLNGINPKYWGRGWANREKRSYQIKRFERFVSKYSSFDIKGKVRSLIEAKIDQLIDVKTKPIYTHPYVVEVNSKTLRFPQWWNNNENTKTLRFPYVDECGNSKDKHTEKQAFCKVTNLSLNIGIKQNKTLSAKGVEYYYQNERDTYNKVLYSRLSDKMKTQPLKKQFSEIAHSLRNARHNPKHNLARDLKNLEQDVPMMFSYADMLREDKKKIYLRFKKNDNKTCQNLTLS